MDFEEMKNLIDLFNLPKSWFRYYVTSYSAVLSLAKDHRLLRRTLVGSVTLLSKNFNKLKDDQGCNKENKN